MKILRMTNKDKGFYATLGPFLARRDVEREIGYQIYDDDGKDWLIAVEMKKVVGFCYLWKKPKHYQIGSCYVIENYRQRGIFRDLLAEATKSIIGVVTLITNSKIIKELLEKEGFAVKKEGGGFVEYSKEYRAVENI